MRLFPESHITVYTTQARTTAEPIVISVADDTVTRITVPTVAQALIAPASSPVGSTRLIGLLTVYE